MTAPSSPPYAALISNVPKSVKESEIALKISDTCGKTVFEYLIEYTPKQPCYLELAKTSEPLTNMWLVVEFVNPNSLAACLAMDGMEYKESKLRVRMLTSKEYDDACGHMGIMKARTKRFKKEMKGKRLIIVLASNVSSRVTPDALYKFFSFPGDPIELTIDRSRKIALIAYDTEEQAVVALACDQAVLGPAMIRIELYKPDRHGKDLQMLLKVGHTGDVSHVGAPTGYVQISERNASLAPESPAYARSGAAPSLYDPSSRTQLPSSYSASASSAMPPSSSSLYPYSNTSQGAPVPTTFGASPSSQGSSANRPNNSYNNPYGSPSHGNGYPPSSHSGVNPYQHPSGAPSGRPDVSNRDWSNIVPSAHYTVTTEFK